jgi:pyruvate formate lyase activating enzyme
MHPANYWHPEADSAVRCELDPHNCKIADGKRGICGVRENRGGKLYSLVYGRSTGPSIDPIEKKPLYHFYPGSKVLSYGTVGCNLKCLHCQNYTTSQAEADTPYLQDVKLDEIPLLCREYKCGGVAWTYNEPTVWFEFTLDGCKVAKKYSLYTCYVTNGFINEAPLREIAPFLDAMNIDVKGFTEDFYRKICKAKLQSVLDTCVLAKSLKIHIELTYLVIPAYNDSESEMRKFSEWAATTIGKDVPVHFSRFHPDYKLVDVPATPAATLKKAHGIAKAAGLEHVYIGNVPGSKEDNTYCPKCGTLLIERQGFFTNLNRLKGNDCPKCGTKVNIRV